MPAASQFIIDGNNLIHRHPELSALARTDFATARQRLVALIDAFAGGDDEITVVFDGTTAGPAKEFEGSNTHVEFSPRHLSADTVIERMVSRSKDPARITVVTSDRGEREAVEASGGASMSCIAFIELLEQRDQQLRRQTRKDPPKNKLGDFFPDGM